MVVPGSSKEMVSGAAFSPVWDKGRNSSADGPSEITRSAKKREPLHSKELPLEMVSGAGSMLFSISANLFSKNRTLWAYRWSTSKVEAKQRIWPKKLLRTASVALSFQPENPKFLVRQISAFREQPIGDIRAIYSRVKEGRLSYG